MLRHLQRLSKYNQWANGRLYDAAATLAEKDYQAEQGAFFGSVHGTLSHILVADRIWMERLTGEGETYDRLDIRPFDTLAALREARESEDARIIAFVHSQTDASLTTSLSYTNIAGEPHMNPLRAILAHVFNHQTHHRGQAHTLLTQLKCEVPSLDLIQFD
jgi:uncharacterized damage-inducible protein DinB